MTSKDNLNPEPTQLGNVSGEFEVHSYQMKVLEAVLRGGDTVYYWPRSYGRNYFYRVWLPEVKRRIDAALEALPNSDGTGSADSTDALSDLTNKEN